MKRILFAGIIAIFLMGMVLGTAQAGHYINGVEGIKAATIPPPGFYYRMYHIYYNADSFMDNSGDEAPIGFDVSVYAIANRFIWMSDYKFLGADFGMDMIIPVVYTDIDIDIAGIHDDEFGMGDICFEPLLLSWHEKRYDTAFAIGVYLPTGKFDTDDAASPGLDYWTLMFSGGGTYYFDTDRTFSASILARYEIHSEQGKTDITPGNDFHFEWGVGKSFAQIWEAGLTGYCHWQITEDSGGTSNNDRDQVYAVGPEVGVVIPPLGLMVSLRSLWEFGAEDRPEGNITSLTLTKGF